MRPAAPPGWFRPASAFAGFRVPSDVIVVAVPEHLRFNLSYRKRPRDSAFESVHGECSDAASHEYLRRSASGAAVELVDDLLPDPPTQRDLLPGAHSRIARFCSLSTTAGRPKSRRRPTWTF